MPSLLKSPRYKKFIDQRDQALEKILHKYLTANSVVMGKLIAHTLDVVSGLAHTANGVYGKKDYEKRIEMFFAMASESSWQMLQRLRASTYMLAHTGEVEAIGQALKRPMQAKVDAHKIQHVKTADSFYGSDPEKMIRHMYTKLYRKVLNAIDTSMVMEEPATEMIDRVRAAFPKPKTIPRPKRQLRSLREAEADVPDWLKQAREEYIKDHLGEDVQTSQLSEEPPVELTQGIIDDAAWEQMVDDYKSDQLPDTMFGRTTQDFTEEDGVRTYDWELEKELTNDFVSNVRDGQVDAANENGIVDMEWISVSHKTLCDHCAWRDGLTSKEIEDKLKDERADDVDDGFDSIVPPLHAFCFCKTAPITQEAIDSTPDDSISKEFDEWLMSS